MIELDDVRDDKLEDTDVFYVEPSSTSIIEKLVKYRYFHFIELPPKLSASNNTIYHITK